VPIVLVIIIAGGAGIFNYEKINNSVVSSSLYALRVHPEAREVLGDEIYFAHRIPWISGTIDPMHGEIDVSFGVKGSKGTGVMRFRAIRPRKDEFVGLITSDI
jgi:cytochrome c oxidase assembly factor 1